jgi:hypothetical protein
MELNEQADGLTVTVKKASKKKAPEKTEESEKSE